MRRNVKRVSNATIIGSARQIERKLYSPSISLILMLASIGGVVYTAILLQPSYRGNWLPYLMVILSEFFIVSHGLVSFWTILSGRRNPRDYGFFTAKDNLFSVPANSSQKAKTTPTKNSSMFLSRRAQSVDVFIPVFGEPTREVEQTASAARDMNGKHRTFILDDGQSDEIKKLALNLGIGYIRRRENINAKAGNINHALAVTKSDLFVILDADFVPSPKLLEETIPFFHDKLIAFVQTPQFYSNQTNFVSIAAGHMQHVFYSLVQPGKNRSNAAFCVGTNVVFRRSAIDSIGGIYDKSKSEDIWTSLKLHEKGYRSIYLNSVLAIGKAPESLKAYSKQQLRWATGSFEIFLKQNPLFNKKLSIDQRIQYFGTTSFYFNGFAIAVLLSLPALQIFFNLTPIALNIPLWQWIVLYSGFYVLQIILSMYTMGGFKLQTLMLSMASFPIYIKAFFKALLNKDEDWKATNSIDSYDSPFNYIRVQTYIFVFLSITTVVGIWKSGYTSELSISIAWCLLNTIVFGSFVIVGLLESTNRKKLAGQHLPHEDNYSLQQLNQLARDS